MYTNKAELNSVTSLKTIETLLTLSGPHISQTPNVLKKKNKQTNKKKQKNWCKWTKSFDYHFRHATYFFSFLKYLDGDFTQIIYEKIGKDLSVKLRDEVVWITGTSSGISEQWWKI